MVDDDEEYLGIQFTNEFKLEKSNRVIARVECIYPGVGYYKLSEGVSFEMREGSNVIAHGKVIDEMTFSDSF